MKGDTRASKLPRAEVFIRSSGGCKAEMGLGRFRQTRRASGNEATHLDPRHVGHLRHFHFKQLTSINWADRH